jgi:protein-L-isoaspartate(D-aspartate) O-methyltransferase
LKFNKKKHHILQDTYRHKGLRRRLVRELRQKGLHDERVLGAIAAVPRHFFVEKAFDDIVYNDQALPIGNGQTISQPYTVAYQTTLLNVQPNDKILEIGTGSGYQTCILAELGAQVFTIERQKTLYEAVGKLLQQSFQHYHLRISVFFRDGYLGLTEHAPFQKIIVTAAAPEVPNALLQQLDINGILVIPVGDSQKDQTMYRITRRSETKYDTEALATFRFVPFLDGLN